MGLFVCRCGQPEDTADYESIKTYDGERKLGMRHGKGSYCFPNGDMYDGEWKWGSKHGYGVYTYADGTKQKGFFYEDQYVGEDPGDLFAEPRSEEYDPARPLSPPTTHNTIAASARSQSMEDILRQRNKERNAQREIHRKRREEIIQKYDLRKNETRTRHGESPRNRRPRKSKTGDYVAV